MSSTLTILRTALLLAATTISSPASANSSAGTSDNENLGRPAVERCARNGVALKGCAMSGAALQGAGHWSQYLPAEPARVPVSNRLSYLARQQGLADTQRRVDSCAAPGEPNRFSIAHRGAPALFPEHTREGYLAAIHQGAGIIECDVTFTKDGALVCRHAQCDLHRTTNILATPLASRCRTPFTGASDAAPATVSCCASDLTLEEFRSLCGKHDRAFPDSKTALGYQHGQPLAPDQYPGCGTLMTLDDSIALFERHGRAHAPELKAADAALPMTQAAYAQALIDRYQAAGVAPERVFPQSFDPRDVSYWLKETPAWGANAVLLDSRDAAIDPADPKDPGLDGTGPTFAQLNAMGLRYLAPPMAFLLRADNGQMVPSSYALDARRNGLSLIAWTLERSGSISNRVLKAPERAYYYRSVLPALRNDGDILTALQVLAEDVGVSGVFSDWPATTTAYANCLRSDTRH